MQFETLAGVMEEMVEAEIRVVAEQTLQAMAPSQEEEVIEKTFNLSFGSRGNQEEKKREKSKQRKNLFGKKQSERGSNSSWSEGQQSKVSRKSFLPINRQSSKSRERYSKGGIPDRAEEEEPTELYNARLTNHSEQILNSQLLPQHIFPVPTQESDELELNWGHFGGAQQTPTFDKSGQKKSFKSFLQNKRSSVTPKKNIFQ